MFDPQTNLPARIRVIDADSIGGDSTSDVLLGDWRAVSGAKIPHRIVYELNGRQVGLYEFSQITANPSLAADTFEIPAEAKGKAAKAATENVPYQWVLRRQSIGVFLDSDAVSYDPDASPGFRLSELAPGVQHVVGGSHNSLVVEMKDYLIVFDAPVGEAQSTWTINAAKAKYPGKPVRYIVLTHHHMDHAGGVRTYIAEGATLVVGAPNKTYFERVIGAPHQVDNDRLQKATRWTDPIIMEILSYMELNDGNRRVRIERINNRHAEGMLIAYIPDAKLGFVTDLWSPVAQTTGSPLQADLLAAAKALRLDPTVRFAGGHGGVATVADLERLTSTQ